MQWYVIYTLSGSEKRIKQMIIDQAVKQGISEFFEDIVVPIVEIPEVKRGKSTKVEKKFMPGYILIKMNMTNDSWHLVKNIPKVTGFLGTKSVPYALTKSEIENIFSALESETRDAKFLKSYEVGEIVTVTDGPFETFTGTIEEIDFNKNRMRLSISIFGKATPIELNFTQVKKNDFN